MMFAHLHLHSEYSVLDGYIRLPELMERVKSLGQNSVAITDHGSLSAILKAYKISKEYGIKLVPGCEFYIAEDRTQDFRGRQNKQNKQNKQNRHFLMLARNEQGWKNFLALNEEAYRTGRTMRFGRVVPRIDSTLLTPEHCKGIIAFSGCMAGEIPFLLDHGHEEEAADLAFQYKELFDAFYLEMQTLHAGETGEAQLRLNCKIERLAAKTNLPMVVTTDAHCLTREDEKAHELLLAIQSKKSVHDKDRFYFTATPIIGEEEILRQGFAQEVLDNTVHVANTCEEPNYLATEGFQIPAFEVGDNDEEYNAACEKRGISEHKRKQPITYFNFQIQKGWQERIKPLLKKHPEKRQLYEERLKEERDIITTMGFIDVFLIVADFIEWARKQNIAIGPGRGSVGGSLLAYLLRITKIDPLHYELLFSRFLNVDRVTLPDIDTDIDHSRREEVRQYIVDKYGVDRTASISTFGTMKLRACIRDVIRSTAERADKGESFLFANQVAATVPQDYGDISYEQAVADIPEFATYMQQYPALAQYIQGFEGLVRQTGIHAAGMIIGKEPLVEKLPIVVDKNGVVAVAYDGSTLEDAGYFKLDLLGLNNLTIIDDIKRSIANNGKRFANFRLTGYPINSAGEAQVPAEAHWKTLQATKTFSLLREGRTAGIFQVESHGMRGLLKSTRVNSIEEIADVLALYRPGPLSSGLTGEYGERKRGIKPFKYLHPTLEPILKKTFGIIVHQEQVMAIAHQCAGFTLSEADTLRRGVAKKKKEIVEELETQFVEGCKTIAGMPDDVITELWRQIQGFDAYGFPKAHSVGYAIIAYQMAYLKANYPTEFWSALITHENKDATRVNQLIREAQAAGIKFLPINVNRSTSRYNIEKENVLRRDFSGLKGVGTSAVQDIIANQPFANICDFMARTGRSVTSKVVKALIKGGAFDDAFEGENHPRWVYDAGIDTCNDQLKKWKARVRRKKNPETAPFTFDWEPYVGARPWDVDEIVDIETELFGTAVTYHPLDNCEVAEAQFYERMRTNNETIFQLGIDQVENFPVDHTVYLFCVSKGVKRKIPYKSDKHVGKFLYIIEVGDRTGEGDLFLFNDDYEQQKDNLKTGNILSVVAKVNFYNGRYSLRFAGIQRCVRRA